MRRLLRVLRGRFGIAAARVTVRTTSPWYLRALLLLLLFAMGYALAYLRLVGTSSLLPSSEQAPASPAQLQTKVVHLERQLQVERAAQASLAKEMAAMQDEDLRLKEDVAFYKSILTEGGTTGVLKIYSAKLNKGAWPGEYQYQILLVQSGRHDKAVQGGLQLVLNVTQDGKPATLRVDPDGQAHGVKVNFKYYQRIEGTFNVPQHMVAQSLQMNYVGPNSSQPSLSQTVNIPN